MAIKSKGTQYHEERFPENRDIQRLLQVKHIYIYIYITIITIIIIIIIIIILIIIIKKKKKKNKKKNEMNYSSFLRETIPRK